MTTTLDPATLRRVLSHDFRDALDDFSGAVPPNAEQYTSETVSALLRHLYRCESYLLMLERTAKQAEQCADVRGMVNDIGQPSWELGATGWEDWGL